MSEFEDKGLKVCLLILILILMLIPMTCIDGYDGERIAVIIVIISKDMFQCILSLFIAIRIV